MDENMEKKDSAFLHSLILTFLFIIVLIFFILTVFSVGIYKYGWEGRLTKKLASVIPYPVAIVNGQVVTFDRLWKTEAALRILSGEKKSQTGQIILEDMVRDEIVSDLVEDNGVQPTLQEWDEYHRHILKKLGMEDNAVEALQSYGFSEKDFKSTVVLPDLKMQKLKIWWNDERGKVAQETGESILRELDRGETFADLARIYSSDEESKYIGGDLGFLSENELPPWLTAVSSKLELGEVSRVTTTPEGFAILKLEALDENQNLPLRQVAWIFWNGSDIENYLNQQKSNCRILVFKDL